MHVDVLTRTLENNMTIRWLIGKQMIIHYGQLDMSYSTCQLSLLVLFFPTHAE